MNHKLTLGSDPEIHLTDKKANVVSSIRVLKQNKSNPIQLGGDKRMYADNVLTEFAFPPSDSVDGVLATIRRTLKLGQARIGDDYKMLAAAARIYGEDELGPKPAVMVGELPPEWEIGCNPSFCAYTGGEKIPKPFADGMRTGSFHIHVGSDLLNDLPSKRLAVKMMDIYVGCAAVLFEKDETAAVRRDLYGRAGDYRNTPYGVEYRSLGNWSLNSPETTALILDLVVFAMSHIKFRTADDILKNINEWTVQEAINKNSFQLARNVLNRAQVPWKLMKRIEKDYGHPDLYKSWGIS